jgi:hypothetical protein
MKAVFGFFGVLVLSLAAQAKVYTPKDFSFVCHGTYQVTAVTNVLSYQYAAPSRSPHPPLLWETKADLELTPVSVSPECAVMGAKYFQAVELGHALHASLEMGGKVESDAHAMMGTVHDFKIEQTIYGENQAGELPLFPKYSIYEKLKFLSSQSGIEVSLGKVDSEKIYGIKEVDNMKPDELVEVSKALATDILGQQLDSVAQEPFYGELLRCLLVLSIQQPTHAQVEQVVGDLVRVFDFSTFGATEIADESMVKTLARSLNESITYSLGMWGDATTAAYKMKILKSEPLLLSPTMLKSGYEYTAHISLAETEELVTEYANQVSNATNVFQKMKFLLALKAMYDENMSSKGKWAPQYSFTPKAEAIIKKTLGENP